jgi:hypothetical protein
VLKEKEDVEDQMCLFAGNTLSKLFMVPFDDDLANVILRENYYNTLNVLRVFEFTILDLMGVDKKQQVLTQTFLHFKKHSPFLRTIV